MSRLVVVTNRIAPVGEGGPPQGGLAVAVLEALKEHGGVWLGWSGKIVETLPDKPRIRRYRNNLTVVELDLTQAEYDTYYLGYANGTLWPAFHYRLDLMEFSRPNLDGYSAVNRRFARALDGLLQPGDRVWVHDYHLIPLASELRALDISLRLGFFLHTPFPVTQVLLGVPWHRNLVEHLTAYDVIGFQTDRDVAAFADYLASEKHGQVGPDGEGEAFGRKFQVQAFPISIETSSMIKQAVDMEDSPQVRRLKAALRGRRLLIGVDRLDYSKGLVRRIRAVERLFAVHPQFRSAVTFMQIAPATRGELHQYASIRSELEQHAGRINGAYADYDWMPIRYISRSYSRRTLAGFYRASAIGLVTPLIDGMNLVAKEYVACQDPTDPGVLVLSRFAGAAQELDGALIVNPYDFEAVGDALAGALEMPLDERRDRHRVLLDRLKRWDVTVWRRAFEAALAA
ncbi:alpha,alpha-trehalose-phosphate synthase (UDP-forming) [Aliidongia dinghuensis]|uniref:Alpha,alpha-trehalose-phosphate synthase (UDP-forming) n=1 Tax=Aliidongia dinghuensis TaxID=1867774 RepID=A0A8J3E597_9PROT|nr:trehalose-6-phosphate synthase [Aliidongia dinghuensis]GGF33960.1 alpha,alpha-trehalose-phosphate synthase (UDP-forming) [Aliidongia dinghuensis]